MPKTRRITGLVLRRQALLSSARLPYLLHFMGLATTLSAAKVLLNTIGAALFLANEGPAQLPVFYMLLALVMISLSSVFGGVVDRASRIPLGQTTLLGLLLLPAALRAVLAIDAPWIYYAILASAHVYEIVLEIVFWVIVAAFLDTIELRRSTSLIYMALAAGGAAGAGLASVLSPFVPTADVLLALPVLGLIAALQLELAKRRLQVLEDPQGGAEDSRSWRESSSLLKQVISRYPLSLLIALNSLMLTVLYGLSEYLVFTVYADTFPEQDALTRFLALAYAAIQIVEFVLLYALTRPLLERAGPLARNLVFPLTSLTCLLGLALSQKLPVALAAHVNAEAISNAVFQPVNTTNYSALPLRFQGRVRTLSDGVFYPSGLALAGLMLLWLQDGEATAAAVYSALVCGLLFVLVNVGVATLFLPTLVRNLRSGVVHLTEIAAGARMPAIPLDQMRMLLRHADPDARAIGLDLAERLEPDPLLDELRDLAPTADRPTRRRIARLLARTTSRRLPGLLDGLLASRDRPSQLIALQTMLARADGAGLERIGELCGASDRGVAALARLAAGLTPGRRAAAGGPLSEIVPWCSDAVVAADVIDACGQARHATAAGLLIALIEVAPVEQQRHGLEVLAEIVAGADGRAAALARRLARQPDARLRAAAVSVLAAVATAAGVLEALGAALGDDSRLVRERAALALAGQGDAAVPLVASQLRSGAPATVEAAVHCLGRIGSPRAASALRALLDTAYADAARNLDWLRQLPQGAERANWRALELALEDRNQQIVDLVLNIATALGGQPSLADLRHALLTDDQRTRANALEALLASPQRRLLQPVAALLVAMHAPDSAGRAATAIADRGSLLVVAARAPDPWIRRAAEHTAQRLTAPADAPALPPAAHPAGAPHLPATATTEFDMEQILFLKRVSLFRHLPLDTLLAVSRTLERRHYLAGETVFEGDARWDHFSIVESGAVDLFNGGEQPEHLRAPAHFGELVLADEAVRAPRVVAAEDTSLLRLHRIVFRDLSRDHPEVLMELCKLLAHRIRRGQAYAPA